MERHLTVYFRADKNYNASIYYRVLLPIATMQRLRLPILPLHDPYEADKTSQQRWLEMHGSDFNLWYQTIGGDLVQYVRDTRTWEPKKDELGKLRYPPTIILDTDDDVFNVMPLNPAFGNLGWKGHDGEPLKDGDSVWVITPEGKHLCIWQDGQNMDLARNREALDTLRQLMAEGDLITCSTPRVAEYVKREIGDGVPTHVYPNCIDFNEYPNIELREHPGEVRILWQGSTTHWEDLWPLRESFGRLAKKYPHIKYVFWVTGDFKWMADYIPNDNVVFIPWCPYQQYKLRLSMINHDISLAPLQPHTFNLSRSGIKWYESSAICRPAATLAQATGAYLDEIQEGETGMLYSTPEEFEAKLSHMIEDERFRNNMAENAKDWVRTNRDPVTHVRELYNAYLAAWERRKLRPVIQKPRAERRREKKNAAVSAKHGNVRKRTGVRSG